MGAHGGPADWWTTNYLWHGKISIIQIYNRDLSESEIRQNFNATRSIEIYFKPGESEPWQMIKDLK